MALRSCRYLIAFCLLGFSMAPVGAPAFAQENGAESTSQATQLRSVKILHDQQALVLTGWVNQVSGPVEYLACGPGGKTHESILVLNANPVDVHAASLLLGWVPMGTTLGPQGKHEIWVEWEKSNQPHRVRAEKLLYDLIKDQPLEPLLWIFTGSTFQNGQYMALLDESFVAVYGDEWAIFNAPEPYGLDDDRLLANSDELPPIGTPVRCTIRGSKE